VSPGYRFVAMRSCCPYRLIVPIEYTSNGHSSCQVSTTLLVEAEQHSVQYCVPVDGYRNERRRNSLQAGGISISGHEAPLASAKLTCIGDEILIVWKIASQNLVISRQHRLARRQSDPIETLRIDLCSLLDIDGSQVCVEQTIY
jgi:hypothetical protein